MSGFKDLPQGLIDAVNEVLKNDIKEELCPGCNHPAAECECPKEDCGYSDEMKKEDEDKEDGEGKKDDEKKLDEETPPGMEDWVLKNKSRFKSEYGSGWEEKLYATAWKIHNQKESISLGENIAIDPSDLASSEPRSAIGQRNSEMPKHVDIVKEDDFRPISAGGTRTEGYRLLLQYSTNTRPQFVPELSLPAAPTLEALSAMIPGSAEVVEAIANALNLPHLRPAYKGNEVSEEAEKKTLK